MSDQDRKIAIYRPDHHRGTRRFGRIDTLINNAGVFIAMPFTDYTAGDHETVVGVNLTGFFNLTQRAIAEMLKQAAATLSTSHHPRRIRQLQ